MAAKGFKFMKKYAFLFPGQGAQKPGMGKDVYQEFEAARTVFHMADSITGIPITPLCFEGDKKELMSTITLQPAITTVNLALLACIQTSCDIQPAVCAGHSLGEYSALATAGVVSMEDCLQIVQKRGALMHKEALRNDGTMHAAIGLDIDSVADIVTSASRYGAITIANHNSEKQIVLSGHPEALEFAGKQIVSQGGNVIPLNVSGAWHSHLIEGALAEFQAFLSTMVFTPPGCKVIHNVTASAEQHPAVIKEIMCQQFCRRVRWFETMIKLMECQVDVYVEIGPGKVLTGLLRKTLPKHIKYRLYNIFNTKTLDAFLNGES